MKLPTQRFLSAIRQPCGRFPCTILGIAPTAISPARVGKTRRQITISRPGGSVANPPRVLVGRGPTWAAAMRAAIRSAA